MNRRTLGLSLIVALAALVVVGSLTAGYWLPGVAAPGVGTTNPGGGWGYGPHMGSVLAYPCAGPTSTGMMGGSGSWGMGSGGGGMGGGTWGLGLIWPLLIVGAAVAVYFVVNRTDEVGRGGDRALSVLRERYAAGELSEEEYASRRETLRT